MFCEEGIFFNCLKYDVLHLTDIVYFQLKMKSVMRIMYTVTNYETYYI